MTLVRLQIWISAAATCLLALMLLHCAKREGDKGHPVVSAGPIDAGQPIPEVAQLPRLDISYGEGDCAPRFANGMRGTCINGKPCNGFGFKDANGKIQCACFEKVEGCEANTGCSLTRRRCVPLREIERLYPPKGR